MLARQEARYVAKALVIVCVSGLMMGNKSCEEKPVVKQRSLKKIVEMGQIKASPINLPGGGGFDFQFVANQQVYGVLAENEAFALRYSPPIIIDPGLARGDEFLKMTAYDKSAFKSFAKSAGRDNYQVQYSKEAWCMVNLPQAKIAGSVNSFEMIGGGGLSLGYGLGGAYEVDMGPNVDFNVEYAQLDVSMIAMRPLTNKVMAASNVTAKQTKTRVNFSFNIGAFRLGPRAYYQTPLASVTKKALTNSVDSLDQQLKSEEWFTRVLANHDTHIVVIGGQDVRLEAGDQLLVYNEDYYWEGEPCNSRYLGGGAASDSAVAKIELDWVGDEISRGRVIEQTDEAPVIGAKVKLFKFKPQGASQGPGSVQPPTSNRPR